MENKRTRISVMLLVLALLLSVFGITAYAQEEAAPDAAVCYVPGDVNSDGSLDSRDAIYTLYASMGYENYSVSQDCDFNGDGEFERMDAVWLLYASLGMRNHELEPAVHDYHDPVWNWDAETAELTLVCNCGEISQSISAEVTAVTTDATCTEPAFVTYTATAEGYTDVKVVYGDAAAGHEIGEPTCDQAAKCANCDFEIPANGHSYVKNNSLSTAATCQAKAKEVWECSICGDSIEKFVGEPVNHSFAVTGSQELAIGECQYAQEKIYSCIYGCDITKTERTEVYTTHNYVRTTTAEPTCQTEGVTTYTCEGCGDTYTEVIPVASEHAWTYGSTIAVCNNCGAEKAIVKMGSEGLAAEEITSSEIVLENNASITLDDATLESIEQTLVLEVNDVTDSFTNNTDMEIAAVYDLNMYIDGQQVSQFAGEVTVSLPYTLQPGDDVNAIDVYYIDDNGNLTQMQGTYAGGYVTFTTSHFSYYTICITPYCERFGHQESVVEVEATCEEGGYHLVSCNICGMSYIHVEEGMGPKGHRYDELNIEGHCTEDIYYTQKCLECGTSNELFVPAVGHNMILDEDLSVAATCEAPGKEVYRCDHIVNDPADPFLTTNCDYTYEVELARLSHEYEAEELVQDCVNGGGTKYTCKNCGDTYIENATAPAGHAYKLLDMSWNETKTLVTASLGCENCDWTHTQQAVITRKITAPTCSASGVITYTAKTVYNMVPFQVSVDVPVDAIDHIPGGELQSNAGQHYYGCIMCGEPVGAQNHSWGETSVTTEPTCVDAGEGSQACTICSYEKAITIPATGEHSYKNGKCTVCGFQEGSCNHVRTTEKAIDLAEMGGCGGTIYVESCECGYQTQAGWEVSCNLVHDEEPLYVEDQYGFGYFVHTSRCADCGLTIEYAEYATDYDPDTCTGWNMMITKITLGDTVLVDGQWHDAISQSLSGRVHPTRATGNTVDLREYGLCSEILVEYACPCGELTSYYIEGDIGCDWSYSSEQSTDGMDVYICDSCGAEKHTTWESQENADGCLYTDIMTFTYYAGGEQVYEYANTSCYINHYYTLDRYEMLGDSCTDGLYLWLSCEGCGKTSKSYTQYHAATLDPEYTQLEGVCYNTAIQGTCPCGQRQAYSFEGENQCDFRITGYDEKTQTQTWTCRTCGAVQTECVELISKDDSCMALYLSTVTLSSSGGELLFTGYQHYEFEEHNYDTSFVLAGESCEDGVTVNQTCKDCGYHNTRTTYSHEMFRVAEYDLSGFGLCGGDTAYLSRCACGEDTYLSVWGSCDWSWLGETVDGSSSIITYQCVNCETIRRQETVYGQGINECQTRITTTCTLEKEGLESVSISYDAIENDHLYLYQLSCDGDNCADGYSVHGECQVCGAVEEWSGWSESHDTFPVARETVTENLPADQKLCGELMLTTYRCPCGAEEWQNTEWIGGSCAWGDGYYDEALDTWVDVCSRCGVQWYTDRSFTRKEGETCIGITTLDNIFLRDGVEILRFQESWDSVNHLDFCTFEMMGETCDDGYRVYGSCLRCKDNDHTRIGYGCDTMYTTQIQAVEHEGICGPIVYRTIGCACTPAKESWIDSECRFDYDGWDSATESDRYVCRDCGLVRYCSYGESYTSETDPCLTMQPITDTFVLNGETIGVIDWVDIWSNHNSIYEFTMLGDSCEDGYYVTERCANCDYSWTGEDVRYSHETYRQDYYNLTGYGMCGGHIEHYACPCGLYESWYYDTRCSWNDTDEVDPDTGALYWYCGDCGSTFLSAETAGQTDENCHTESTYVFKLLQNGESQLELGGRQSYDSHDTYVTEALLHDPEGSCEDGVTITRACRNCTWTETEDSRWHRQYEKGYYDLAELLGACEGGYVREYGCACGYYDNSNYWTPCSWSYDSGWTDTIDGVEHEYTRYACLDCNMVRTDDRSEVYTEDSCEYQVFVTRTFSKEGYDSIAYHDDWTAANHQWEETAELMPGSETCEDGVYIYRSCALCGHKETSEAYWHYDVPSVSIDFGALGLCEGWATESACACGESHYCNYDMSCDWGYADEETVTDSSGNSHQVITYICDNCGMTRVRDIWDEKLPGTCQMVSYDLITFSLNGESLGTISRINSYFDHDLDRSYVMDGQTCDEGLTITEYCRLCDYSNSYHTTYHDQGLITETITAPEGSCGGTITVHRCPCGESSWQEWDLDCSFTTVSSDETTNDDGYVTYRCYEHQCYNCGMAYTQVEEHQQQSSCIWKEVQTYTFTYNGNAVGSFHYSSTYNRHSYDITCELLGETCADGVIRTYACTNCDYSYTSTQYGCSRDTVTTYELPEGSCGGTVTLSACPCGNESSVQENYNCSFDYYLESESYGSYGYYAYSCGSCGTIRQYDWNTEDLGNCQQKTIRTYTYSRKEQDDVVVQSSWIDVTHTYDYSYELLTPDTSCDDGILVTEHCVNCGYTNTWENYGHDWNTEYLYMPEVTCGGHVEYYSCPCGYATYWYSYLNCDFVYQRTDLVTDENGPDYNISYYSCSCGLSYAHKYYTEYPETCKVVEHNTYTYYLNDVMVGECTYINTSYTHEHVNTGARLLDGSTTCEDGVEISETCTICGHSSTYTSHNHTHAIVDGSYIDLAEYCGCDEHGVYQTSCACGGNLGILWDGSVSRSSLTGLINQDDDGIYHYLVHYKLNYCDVYYWHEEYTIPNDDGTATKYQEYRFTYSAPSEDDVSLGTIYCKSAS